MLANFTGLDADDYNMAPVGVSAVGDGAFHEMTTPQTFVATGLRVRLDGPVATGSRQFVFRYYDYDARRARHNGPAMRRGDRGGHLPEQRAGTRPGGQQRLVQGG